MFPDYKIAHSKDSQCTVLLDVFSPADALYVKYPLFPIQIYATNEEVDIYNYRLGIINITEIGETQAMMQMGKIHFFLEISNFFQKVMTFFEKMYSVFKKFFKNDLQKQKPFGEAPRKS